MPDLGHRLFSYNSDTMKATTGLHGEPGFGSGDWEYNTWLTYGRSTLDEVTHNQVNVNRLQIALDPAACQQDRACPKDAAGNPTLDIY